MTRQELTYIGQRLFGLKSNGYGWQAEMARQLGITPRAINAWGKETRVPNAIAALLTMLDKERNG